MPVNTALPKKIEVPCPHCGRYEAIDGEEERTWYSPCPSAACPSNDPNRDKMGYCPKCGGKDWETGNVDADAWSDDTPFPTVTIQFVCERCGHEIEVCYDREDKLHEKRNRDRRDWSYDPDPDGNLDLD